jgi:hypothetical protein
VKFSFQSLWVVLGYASTGYRSTCLLVVLRPIDECYSVENGAHLHLLVLMVEMNNRSFEDEEKTSEELLSSFYHTLYLWTTAYVFPLSFRFLDFLTCFFS